MPDTENTEENAEGVDQGREDLGDGGKKALDEERKARRALEKQLKELGTSNSDLQKRLQEFEDRDKSEIDKALEAAKSAASERETFKGENESLKVQLLRQKISATKGLDPDLWDRVRGGTEEEITSDVEALVEKFAPAPKRSGAFRSGASASGGATEKQRAAAALRGIRRD